MKRVKKVVCKAQESVFTPSQQEHTPLSATLSNRSRNARKPAPKHRRTAPKFRKVGKNMKPKGRRSASGGKFVQAGGETQPGGETLSSSAQPTEAGKAAFRRFLTLFDALEPDGLFAVFDHSVHVPGGQSGHRGIVDLQQEFIRADFAAGSGRSARADHRELAVLRAALQLQPPRALLAPAEDTLVDFVGPVVLPLPQTLGHGSGLRRGAGGGNHMSAAQEVGSGRRARPCPRRANASTFSGARQMCPCQRAHSHVPQLDHLDHLDLR